MKASDLCSRDQAQLAIKPRLAIEAQLAIESQLDTRNAWARRSVHGAAVLASSSEGRVIIDRIRQ